MNNIFDIYTEPKYFTYLLSALSFILLFLISSTITYIYSKSFITKQPKKHLFLIFSATFALMHFSGHFVYFLFLFMLVFLFKIQKNNNVAKSLFYLNFGLLFLIFSISSFYSIFNDMLSHIIEPYFLTNDIMTYAIENKPYFSIFQHNDIIYKNTISINNEIVQSLNPSHIIRNYIYLYSLNIIGIIFWIIIYFSLLKKHKY